MGQADAAPPASKYHHQSPPFSPLEVSASSRQLGYDDDGRPARTGNVWTASAHIITAVIGSGVLSLAWAIAQLGWVAGPAVMIVFAFITYYTSVLLAYCYRVGDPVTGKRNYTYMDAVRTTLGGVQYQVCGWLQYLNLFGTNVGYTIAAAISMMAIMRANCFHTKGHDSPCRVSSNPYMLTFGAFQLLLSQIPNFDQIWWLSSLAAVMSFSYSSIGLLLGFLQLAKNGHAMGTLTGVAVGPGALTPTQKTWATFQALGDIAFAYSYSMILIEIQDTVRSPPSEVATMKKATLLSVGTTTAFYMACGCVGYAAFGNSSPGNLLTGFGFFEPFWLLDIANAAIVVHLVGAYQVFAQPIFAFIETWASQRWPDSAFVNREIKVPMTSSFTVTPMRLVWRSLFVVATTVVSMIMPFFNDVVGVLGAMGFWPLTVYYPVEMYIVQKKIPKWSTKWVCLELLSAACLVISVGAGVGSVAGVVQDLKVFKPFHTSY